jgi:hypothetical protein
MQQFNTAFSQYKKCEADCGDPAKVEYQNRSYDELAVTVNATGACE